MSDDVNSTTPYIKDIKTEDTQGTHYGIIPSDQEYGDMLVEEKSDADDQDEYNKYVWAQLLLDVGGEVLRGRVIKRSKGIDGTPTG